MSEPAEIGGPWAYSAYGYTLLSEVKLHCLRAAEPDAKPDLHVSASWSKEVSQIEIPDDAVMRTDAVTADGRPYLSVWAKQEGIRISHHSDEGAVVFTLVGAPPRILVEIAPNTPAVDVEAYLIGRVLGSMMRFLKLTCLHGAFLEVDGAAIGFLGGKGAGKSTILATSAIAGHAVIADDIGVLQASGAGSWSIPPAYPFLRAWPQSIAELTISPRAVAGPVISFNQKRYVDLTVPPFSHVNRPMPLHALVVLGDRKGRTYDLQRLTGAAGLVPLSAHTYAPYVDAPASRHRDLLTLAQVVKQCQVFSLCLPNEVNALENQIEKVLSEIVST
ncbi:hypothetical protein [Gymnodinialimonas sp.]